MVSEISSLLLTEMGEACPGTPRGTLRPVLLNASHHKKHENM